MKPLQIAIDGPVAAGKGDIAARLAKELGLTYIYTGAMYRALALACLRAGTSTKDPKKVRQLLDKVIIELAQPDASSSDAYKVLLNGEDVTERILEPDVAMGASDVSIIPGVRKTMVQRQKELVQGRSVVMEGRDIGLRVLPEAQLKIYLTANLPERAQRRRLQWKAKGITRDLQEVIEDTRLRDTQDMSRAADPLQKLPDAWELDTTKLTQEEVVEKIKQQLKKRHLL